jgi:hypothetical protein
MPAGAKGKMTPETLKILFEGIKLRMTHKLAAVRAGIHPGTYYRWLQEGEIAAKSYAETGVDKGERAKKYRQFYEDHQRAISEGQANLLACVQRAALAGDWKAAQFILACRHPDEFAPRHRTELSGPKGGPIATVSGNEALEKLAGLLAPRDDGEGSPGDSE